MVVVLDHGSSAMLVPQESSVLVAPLLKPIAMQDTTATGTPFTSTRLTAQKDRLPLLVLTTQAVQLAQRATIVQRLERHRSTAQSITTVKPGLFIQHHAHLVTNQHLTLMPQATALSAQLVRCAHMVQTRSIAQQVTITMAQRLLESLMLASTPQLEPTLTPLPNLEEPTVLLESGQWKDTLHQPVKTAHKDIIVLEVSRPNAVLEPTVQLVLQPNRPVLMVSIAHLLESDLSLLAHLERLAQEELWSMPLLAITLFLEKAPLTLAKYALLDSFAQPELLEKTMNLVQLTLTPQLKPLHVPSALQETTVHSELAQKLHAHRVSIVQKLKTTQSSVQREATEPPLDSQLLPIAQLVTMESIVQTQV